MSRSLAGPWLVTMIAAAMIAALTISVLAAPSTKPERRPETSELYATGMEAVRRGDFGAARERFALADAAKPDDPDILNMLAYATRKTGKLEEARVLYLRALALRPEFPECREYLGECYLELAWEQVEALKKSTHAEAPKSLGQLGEAIKALNSALESGKPASLPERGW